MESFGRTPGSSMKIKSSSAPRPLISSSASQAFPERMGALHEYRLFGLHLRSEIELPELPEAGSGSAPDVTIREGHIAEVAPGEERAIVPVEDGVVLVIADVARFEVRSGSEIVIDRVKGVPDRNVRLFLLGSAMGAIMHQRGVLPLHANAIEIGGAAVAYTGPSGEGKSTLAAQFHDRGHRVIADDVSAISFDGSGAAVVASGLPRLRLWREVLEATGRDPAEFQRSYAGAANVEKFDVPVLAASGKGQWPLKAVYLLDRGEEFAFQRLHGVEAAEVIIANTYRGHFLALMGDPRIHWTACIKLVQHVPVFRVRRTRATADIAAEFEQMLAHADQVGTVGD